ncbi:MAG TPA: pyridoxamine 5'-phosphate oxidase family protein [Candidatus Acidoferrales bacterium]|nr:pyridoxamine 5'-phosphate oxidase family protein [Candidatus Acidoferrales bacterium]
MSEPAKPDRQPIVAGATPEERDPTAWPDEVFEPIQRLLDDSLLHAGQAVRDTFDQISRRLDARQFVEMWNACRLKAMSTTGPDGAPHIAPVHAEFVNGRLRSTIYGNAVRLRDIRRNPHVAFTTWAANGATAIVYGQARVLPGSERETRPGATGRPRKTVALEIDVQRIYAMKGREQ